MRRFSRSFLSRRQSRLETIRDETIRVLPRASPHPEHSSRWIFSYLPVSLTSLSLDIRSSPATANRHWIKQLPLTKTSVPVCALSHSTSLTLSASSLVPATFLGCRISLPDTARKCKELPRAHLVSVMEAFHAYPVETDHWGPGHLEPTKSLCY